MTDTICSVIASDNPSPEEIMSMALSPPEHRTERVTIRVRPSELRRFEAAAQVAGVTVSDVLRKGGLTLARDVLRESVDAEEVSS